MADDLREILDVAKRELPDVPDEVWKRFELVIRGQFGATRPYIAAQKKGRHLALLDAAADQDAEAMAKKLGVTVRRVQQLKKLR